MYDVYFHGILCLDRIMRLDIVPCNERNAHILEETLALGGDATNSACAAVRLGLKVVLHPNLIGRDEQGSLVVGMLKKKGLVPDELRRVNRPTPRALILALPDGQRHIIGAFGRKIISPPKKNILKRCRLLCVDNFFGAASRRAMESGRKAGLPVAVNDIDPGEPHFPACDLVFLSSPPDKAEPLLRRAHGRAKGTVVVTMGEEGCLAVEKNSGRTYRQRGFKVKVIDSTGAGDNFRAAFLFGHLKGWALKKTLRFATAFAALSCRGLGAGGALPSVSTVENFARRRT